MIESGVVVSTTMPDSIKPMNYEITTISDQESETRQVEG
jgi:hypothetical protein